MTYVPLSTSKHQHLFLNKGDLSFLHNQPVVSMFSSEASLAALDLPLAFAPAKNSISLVGILSLEKESNAQIGPKGNWMGGYMPVNIRNYPFSIAFTGNQGTVLVEQDSEWLSTEQGDPLFDSQGNPTEILSEYIQSLKKSVPAPALERNVLEVIQKNDLLESFIDVPRKLYRINLQSLNNLSEMTFLQLRKNGALPVIYAHLMSLHRIERIKSLAQQKQNAAQRQQKAASAKVVADFEENIFRFDV